MQSFIYQNALIELSLWKHCLWLHKQCLWGKIIYWLHWWVVLSFAPTGITWEGNLNWEIAFIKLTCKQVYGVGGGHSLSKWLMWDCSIWAVLLLDMQSQLSFLSWLPQKTDFNMKARPTLLFSQAGLYQSRGARRWQLLRMSLGSRPQHQAATSGWCWLRAHSLFSVVQFKFLVWELPLLSTQFRHEFNWN